MIATTRQYPITTGQKLVSGNGVVYQVDSVSPDGEQVTFHRFGMRKAARWTERVERVMGRLRPDEMSDDRCRIITADVLEWAASYDDPPFHALLCDGPYHLTSINDGFTKGGKNNPRTGAEKQARRSKGFLNQTWDGGDIAFRPETWAALGKHLHPGALMMCFAGTRGYHRMACAIEDAGFAILPAIGWIQGQGFPKSTRVKGHPEFGGHRYGGQVLKPSFEFICVAQKPYKGRPVESIVRTGAGTLNIDSARIGTQDNLNGGTYSPNGRPGPMPGDERTGAALGMFAPGARPEHGYSQPAGRWPANLCLDEVAAAALDRQSGVSMSGDGISGAKIYENMCGQFGNLKPTVHTCYNDIGNGASRFFHVSDWQAEEHDPFFYCGKAGRVERSAGLDKPSHHPCVKPLRLTRWLATLLLPPSEYAPRRLLVPFCGSGSEAIGAVLAGWDEVTGVEMSEEYAEIARARAAFWQGNVGLFESLTTTEEEPDPQEAMDLA